MATGYAADLFAPEPAVSPHLEHEHEHEHPYDTQVHSDSMIVPINYRDLDRRSDDFYDSLRYRHYKNPLTRFVMRQLIRGRDASDEGTPSTELKKNKEYFERFRGRTINAVRIHQANVFSSRDTTKKVKGFRHFIDRLHIQTRENQLAQNLLFGVGDPLDPYTMGINEELLRSRPYLSTAYFIVVPDPRDTTAVVIDLFARDNWSISGDITLGSGRKELAVFDRNFLGLTDQLRVGYTVDEWVSYRPAVEVDYTLRNFAGTFADIDMLVGIGESQNNLRLDLQRPFILPDDWAAGFSIGDLYAPEGQRLRDTSYTVGRFDWNLWIGKSWRLGRREDGTHLYAAASYNHVQYNLRPPLPSGAPRSADPYYHNHREVLLNVGIGRKNFFQGNMVYGYGRTEDIPYGFRAELVFGRRWEEALGSRDYYGGRIFWADLIGDHYVEAGIAAGTFLTREGKPQQGVLNATVNYFTPLMRINTGYIRQFLSLSSTMGYHRLAGEREALRYEDPNAIRGLKSSAKILGYNRLTLRSETVAFTPIFLYHFRFAFFAFGDVGWLGTDNNLFRNPFTGAVGLGVRIKNERLVFNNIQLRLGVALNRPDDVRYSHFGLSSEQRYQEFNFTPGRPLMVRYE